MASTEFRSQTHHMRLARIGYLDSPGFSTPSTTLKPYAPQNMNKVVSAPGLTILPNVNKKPDSQQAGESRYVMTIYYRNKRVIKKLC